MGTAALGRPDATVSRLLSLRGSVSAAGREVVLWIVAIALAAGTAALDLMLRDTSTSLIAILLVSMIVGYFGPRRAWRWGLLFAASLPLGHFVVRRGGELAGLLGFVPSFVGAYLGSFLEKMVRELRGSP